MGQCLCKGVEPAIGTLNKGGDVNVAQYQAQASVQKPGAPADGAVLSTSGQNSTVSSPTQLGAASEVPGDDDQEASRLVVETRVNTIVENINRAAVVHDLVASIMTNVSKAASDDTLSDEQDNQTTILKATSTPVNSNVTAAPACAVASNSTTTASAPAPAPLATLPTYSTVVAAAPAAVQSASSVMATSQTITGMTHMETRSAGLNSVSREISPLVNAAIDATVKPTAEVDPTTSVVEASTVKAASDLTSMPQGTALSTGATGASDTGSPSSTAGSPGLADSSDDIVQPTSSGGMSEASTTASVADGKKKKKRKSGKRHKRPPTSASGDATSAANAASKVVATAAAPKPNGKKKTKAK